MTIDLTPATSLSTVAGYGLATSRGILNSTAHIMPAGRASHSTEAHDQFGDRAEIGCDVHDEELRTEVGINGGHGSEHCVEIQCTADESVTTVASPLGEHNLVNDHTHDHGYYGRLDGTCSYCADTHPAEPDIPMQVFDRATGSWIVESVQSEAA